MNMNSITEDEIRDRIKNDITTSMFVEAGAGAGKTTILLERIINQLKAGVKPESIVAITFTKKAAEEMRTRMFAALNKAFKDENDDAKKNNIKYAVDNYEKMQISTIHSFCYKLLMEQALNAKLRMDLSMLEDDQVANDKQEFFNFKWRQTDYATLSTLYELKTEKIKELCFSIFSILADLPEEINVIKDVNLLQKGISSYPKKDKDGNVVNDPRGNAKETMYPDREAFIVNYLINFIEPFADEYKSIEDSHYISNNLLLIKARDLLKGKEEYSKNALEYFRKKYKYFYVDEFQDTDRVQVDLIYSLAKDDNGKLRDGSLFLVGDPKQSIYRFRGADVPLYLNVKKEFEDLEIKGENVKVYELKFNYRSNKFLIEDFVNNVNKTIFSNYVEMKSESTSNNYFGSNKNNPEVIKGVYHIGHSDAVQKSGRNWLYKKEDEMIDLARIIKSLVENEFKIYDRKKEALKNIEYRDFLILCRSTSNMDEYMKVLMENDIPVNISSKIAISDNKILLRIKNIYRYIAYPYGDMIALEGISQILAKGLVNASNKVEIRDKLKKFYQEVKSMEAYTALAYVAHNLDLYIYDEDKLDANKLKRIQTQITQMLETIINNCDNNKMEVYDAISKFIEDGYEREMSQEYESNAVRFMNIHKAKGLEGKIVIICKRSDKRPYYNDKPIDFSYDTFHEDNKYYLSAHKEGKYGKECIPSYANNKTILKKDEDEEVAEYNRLAYVAVTRAEEALIVMNLLTARQELLNKYIDSIKNKDNLLNITIMNKSTTLGDYIKDDSNFILKSNSVTSLKWIKNVFVLEQDDKQKEKLYNRISPSLLAKEDKVAYAESSEEDTIKNISDKSNNGNSEQENDEPLKNEVDTIVDGGIEIKGAVYGTIMHRVFELIVNSYVNNKRIPDANSKEIETIVNFAIIESYETISKFKKIENGELNINDYIGKLKKVLKEDIEKFNESDLMVKIIPSAKRVFTELSFEYVDNEFNNENDKSFKSGLNSLVNGRADLVIINSDNSVLIVDYKSNINKNMTAKDFKEQLGREYKAQLDFYKRVLYKVCQEDENKVDTQIYNKYI